MRIKDKIANKILNYLGKNVKISNEEYLNIECGIADIIDKELSKWIKYDVDLNEHEKR